MVGEGLHGVVAANGECRGMRTRNAWRGVYLTRKKLVGVESRVAVAVAVRVGQQRPPDSAYQELDRWSSTP